MQPLKKVIETLRASRYLTATIDSGSNTINNISLLENGIKYSEQLLQHWRQTHILDNEASAKCVDLNVNHYDHSAYIHYFVNTEQFQNGIKFLHDNECLQQDPIILKSIQTTNTDRTVSKNESFKRTLLVTDFIINPAVGLRKFFNIQRACKIWWMRFSSDPSKYFLESHNFNGIIKSELVLPGTQSVAIKLKFPYNTFTVEDITFIPLTGTSLKQNSKQASNAIPGVIRSVIDLHAAAGAIIFDSGDNDRKGTMMINRKLAPYQCAVSCYHQGKHTPDLEDLCTHLKFVLKRTGLRLVEENTIFTKSSNELDAEFEKYDSLGIPYTLIINENTLKTGLLKLRSRDTTLEEKIHISDIPEYLLQIFNS